MTVERITIGIPTEIDVDGEHCGPFCPLRWPARSRCMAFNEQPHQEGTQIVQAKGSALRWSDGGFIRCAACLDAERLAREVTP